MPYTPRYTTINRIKLKLKFRLGVNEDAVSEPFPGITESITQQTVDPDLLLMVIEEKEAFLDSILRQVYELPLLNEHTILSEIVEGLVIADIMRVYFQGMGMANIAADVSAMSGDLKGHAYYLIGTLTSGRNLYLPNNIPVPGNLPGMPSPAPLMLPGERLVPPSNIVKRVDVLIGNRTRHNSSEHMDIDWGIEEQTNLSARRARDAQTQRGF